MEDIGNQTSDIHVEGGEYGIITKRTANDTEALLYSIRTKTAGR